MSESQQTEFEKRQEADRLYQKEVTKIQSGIRKRYLDAKFSGKDDEQQKIVDEISDIVYDDRDLLLIGKIGTGKTYLISGLINDDIESRYKEDKGAYRIKAECFILH